MTTRKGAIVLSPQFQQWLQERGDGLLIQNLQLLQETYTESLAYADAAPEHLAKMAAKYERLLKAIRAVQG